MYLLRSIAHRESYRSTMDRQTDGPTPKKHGFGRDKIYWYPLFEPCSGQRALKSLPEMPILGSSNSVANKDMMSKLWKNRGTII